MLNHLMFKYAAPLTTLQPKSISCKRVVCLKLNANISALNVLLQTVATVATLATHNNTEM